MLTTNRGRIVDESRVIDGMSRSIPDHGGAKLPVINALYGAITVDKEIDLEENDNSAKKRFPSLQLADCSTAISLISPAGPLIPPERLASCRWPHASSC